MTSDLIAKERALDVIGPERLRLLAECHMAGWDDWLAIRSTRPGASLTKTARARIVYDGAVRHATSVFPEAMCGRRHGLLILDFEVALARFKLLHSDLSPRGIPTGQSKMFADQTQVEQTSIWPLPPMLIVGYVLDRLGTTVARQVLVLRRRDEIVWEHDLRASGQTGTVGFMPSPQTPPAPAEVHSGRTDAEVEKADQA